jgi:hypothetical protein
MLLSKIKISTGNIVRQPKLKSLRKLAEMHVHSFRNLAGYIIYIVCLIIYEAHHALMRQPLFIYSIYGPLLNLGGFFSFVLLHTVGRTPWTVDQPVARQLPTR